MEKKSTKQVANDLKIINPVKKKIKEKKLPVDAVFDRYYRKHLFLLNVLILENYGQVVALLMFLQEELKKIDFVVCLFGFEDLRVLKLQEPINKTYDDEILFDLYCHDNSVDDVVLDYEFGDYDRPVYYSDLIDENHFKDTGKTDTRDFYKLLFEDEQEANKKEKAINKMTFKSWEQKKEYIIELINQYNKERLKKDFDLREFLKKNKPDVTLKSVQVALKKFAGYNFERNEFDEPVKEYQEAISILCRNKNQLHKIDVGKVGKSNNL